MNPTRLPFYLSLQQCVVVIHYLRVSTAQEQLQDSLSICDELTLLHTLRFFYPNINLHTGKEICIVVRVILKEALP